VAYEPPQATRAARDASPEAIAEEAARSGFERGFARGQADGRAALEGELARLRERFGASMAQLAELERHIVDENKARVLGLALEIAGRVVRERIAAGDPVAERVAAEVLADAPRSGTRVLRVHPDDHAALLQALPRLREQGSITLEMDPSISPGGVVVETPLEKVDARLETALSSIADALEEAK
jgi:flagellar assembly protein FliH